MVNWKLLIGSLVLDAIGFVSVGIFNVGTAPLNYYWQSQVLKTKLAWIGALEEFVPGIGNFIPSNTVAFIFRKELRK